MIASSPGRNIRYRGYIRPPNTLFLPTSPILYVINEKDSEKKWQHSIEKHEKGPIPAHPPEFEQPALLSLCRPGFLCLCLRFQGLLLLQLFTLFGCSSLGIFSCLNVRLLVFLVLHLLKLRCDGFSRYESPERKCLAPFFSFFFCLCGLRVRIFQNRRQRCCSGVL